MSKKLTIAVVGLGFGGEFIPLYANHPDVSQVVICDTDPEVTGQMAGRFNVQEQRRDLDAVLADDQIDARTSRNTDSDTRRAVSINPTSRKTLCVCRTHGAESCRH